MAPRRFRTSHDGKEKHVYNFEIRVFGSGNLFPYGKHPQTFVSFRAFGSVDEEVVRLAKRFEVLATVPANSYCVGLATNDADGTDRVETNATGTYVAIVGENLEMVRLAWEGYTLGLAEHLAKVGV